MAGQKLIIFQELVEHHFVTKVLLYKCLLLIFLY
jgi:hypothetical protein